MGHHDKVNKLGRTKAHREATLSNMAMSLFIHRVIKTTHAKARALRPVVDRIISTAKKNDLASKRRVARIIRQKAVFKKLFGEIVPQFADRDSGFTRVVRVGVRRGDGAPMSVVELLIEKPVEVDDKKGKKSKKLATTAAKSAAKVSKKG